MVAMHDHYDKIVIGSAPCGGALAYRLAGTGKRILMLERGGYPPRKNFGLLQTISRRRGMLVRLEVNSGSNACALPTFRDRIGCDQCRVSDLNSKETTR